MAKSKPSEPSDTKTTKPVLDNHQQALLIPPPVPFLGAGAGEPRRGAVAIFGVPYDKTASFRKGTRGGPDALRSVSDAAIETYSPAQDRDLEDFDFVDLGNVELNNDAAPELIDALVFDAAASLLQSEAIPCMIGGEHSVSPGAIRAAFEMHPDLVVIQIDAHADLRESYEGSPHSHACAMRRILDFLPSDHLLQVGIRSGTREEFAEMKREERYVAPSGAALAGILKSRNFENAPIWVTFDIDAFDPAEVPGTGTPEAGGITWKEAEELRSVLSGRQIVGFDIVELAPDLDPSGISTALAAKLVREWVLMVGDGK